MRNCRQKWINVALFTTLEPLLHAPTLHRFFTSRLRSSETRNQLKLMIESTLDPMFHPDSYGYGPGKPAKQAIAVTRKRCWQV